MHTEYGGQIRGGFRNDARPLPVTRPLAEKSGFHAAACLHEAVSARSQKGSKHFRAVLLCPFRAVTVYRQSSGIVAKHHASGRQLALTQPQFVMLVCGKIQTAFQFADFFVDIVLHFGIVGKDKTLCERVFAGKCQNIGKYLDLACAKVFQIPQRSEFASLRMADF